MGLAEFLEKVWEVVGRAALAQILGSREEGAVVLEEDARLTALFLWTLQSTNGATPTGESEARDSEEDPEEEDDDETPRRKRKGLSLTFDVVRRFAQPLGIHLSEWEHRVIEIEKGVVRLLPVTERARQLFGEEGAETIAARLEMGAVASPQRLLFPELEVPRPVARRGRRARVDVSDESLTAPREATTLDRIHAAMLLQAGGRAHALRNFLKAEQDRGPAFVRLANALSALYPRDSDEKRLLDATLLAVPR